MNKIALISLRNDYIDSRSERRDSIDTKIYDLVSDIGLIPLPVPNEPIFMDKINTFINYKNVKCVILSGGKICFTSESFKYFLVSIFFILKSSVVA